MFEFSAKRAVFSHVTKIKIILLSSVVIFFPPHKYHFPRFEAFTAVLLNLLVHRADC